jgi:hypothetical protein
LTRSPDAPPRAPNPKRLSAARAACESRAIHLPLQLPLRVSTDIFDVRNHTAVQDEPDMKITAKLFTAS